MYSYWVSDRWHGRDKLNEPSTLVRKKPREYCSLVTWEMKGRNRRDCKTPHPDPGTALLGAFGRAQADGILRY